MAREFNGNINNGDHENDFGFNDMYEKNKEEIERFMDELSQYSDEEIEEALGNAIANGDEGLKRMKIQQETDLMNEVLKNVGGDEYQKGILRGIGKQNIEDRASFVGEKCDEEKRQKFVRMEGAIKMLAGASGLSDDSVYISRPSRNQSYGMVQIEVPDCFAITSKNRYFLAELIRLADETTFAVEKNLDGTPIESPNIGMAFTVDDVWS